MATNPRKNYLDETPRYKRRHPNAFRFSGNKLGRMNNKKFTPGRDMNRNCASNNDTYVVSL